MASAVAEPRSPRAALARTRKKQPWRNGLGWVFLILVGATWAVTLRPVQLGGPATFVVVSGDSMEPVLHEGDLVVLRSQDSYDLGDIVTFAVPRGEPGEGALVIHRLIDRAKDTWIPKGDNRDVEDDWRPTDREIKGELWLHIPRGGDRLMNLMNPPLLAALAGGAATMWFLLRDAKPRTTQGDDDA